MNATKPHLGLRSAGVPAGQTRPDEGSALRVPWALMLLSGGLALPTVAGAAGYTVQQISSPGPALRMSPGGAVAGNYVARCVTLSTRPKRTICYWAPWVFDGKRVAKLAGNWPNDVDTRCAGVNDALELVGRDTQAALAGAWMLSGGGLTYTGFLPGGNWSSLVAINNLGVAVGSANAAGTGLRAVTFSNGVLAEVLFNDPALSAPTTGTSAMDVNDAGMVAGTYAAADGDRGFVVDASGAVTLVPNLPNAAGCRPARLSQVHPASGQVWLAGQCGGRPFLFEVTSGTLRELANLPGGSNLSVQSVNSEGVAVGTAIRPGGSAPAGYTALLWPAGSTVPVDLNANNGFAPATAWNVHGTDINDRTATAGATVLAGYNDSSGNFFTFQLRLAP